MYNERSRFEDMARLKVVINDIPMPAATPRDIDFLIEQLQAYKNSFTKLPFINNTLLVSVSEAPQKADEPATDTASAAGETAPNLSTDDPALEPPRRPPKKPPQGKRSIDFMVHALEDLGGFAPVDAVLSAMMNNGWCTDAKPHARAIESLKSTARTYRNLVQYHQGIIKLTNVEADMHGEVKTNRIRIHNGQFASATGVPTTLIAESALCTLVELRQRPARSREVADYAKDYLDFKPDGDYAGIIYKALERSKKVVKFTDKTYVPRDFLTNPPSDEIVRNLFPLVEGKLVLKGL